MNVKIIIRLLPLLLCIASCAPVVRNPVALDVAKNVSQGTPREYRIQSGDQLEIKFFYQPELNELVTVRPDGRISLQLANEIDTAGLTPAELTDQLKKKYSAEIGRPEITVFVRSFSAQRVYVDGEVAKPGSVPLTDLMTALQAISQAGGFKETARTNEVILIRKGKDSTILSSVLDLEKAIDGSDTGQDIALMPFDIVYVPRSSVANMNLWVDQYIRKNIPTTVGIGFAPFND